MADSEEKKKKVLVIGTSGLVGMATRDAIKDYLGVDVVTYDRPNTGTVAQKAIKQEERDTKVVAYNHSVEAGSKLLDGRQAAWLLKGREKLTENERGHVSSIDTEQYNYTFALDQGVSAIVIAAGKPISGTMGRNEVGPINAPDFANYGKTFADYAAKRIEQDDTYHLPVIINAGNPVDTLTEILGRELHAGLARHAMEAKKDGKSGLSKLLAAEARSLKGKIIGLGGVLDSARAATAIHEVFKNEQGDPLIPMENIIQSPVLGTHNANMVVDFDNVRVLHNGEEIALKDYPGIDLTAKYTDKKTGKIISYAEAISELTRAGGTEIKTDYKEQLGLIQSATVGTGAALMIMADAIVNDKKIDMPVAVYHVPGDSQRLPDRENSSLNHRISEGFVMGAMATLGKDGATYRAPSADMVTRLTGAEENARSEYQRVTQSIIPSR